MQILEIRNFGPISECKLEIDDFVVLTGVQASGKSTIAKSVFFFNNIKNLLYQLVGRIVSRIEEDTMEIPLAQRLKREIRNNFLQIFGTTMALDSQMNMKYRYENGETIEISLTDTSAQRNFADNCYVGALVNLCISYSLHILQKLSKTKKRCNVNTFRFTFRQFNLR